jgi:microsomal epoxide hydrolase
MAIHGLALLAIMAVFKLYEAADNPAIVPYKVNVPLTDILDLKLRLSMARLGTPQLSDVKDFTWGVNKPTLIDYKNYWQNQFSWKKQEKKLNSLPQFTTEIEGLKIHFVHSKAAKNSNYTTIVPICLVHGWPGTVYDFYKIIPMLNDPRKYLDPTSTIAYDVVAPSLPGYGFSAKPTHTGWNQEKIARAFNTLMTQRLNFTRYIPQGGDWGFVITSNMARLFPEKVLGLHINHICALPFSCGPAPLGVNISALATSYDLRETGYFLQHVTRPDSHGLGYNDSPLGLLGYWLEKYCIATDPNYILLPDGGLSLNYTKDELLTSISIEWFNQNAISSIRLYREYCASTSNVELSKQYVNVPTGYAATYRDIPHCQAVSPAVANGSYNICHYTQLTDGGHYTALEVPNLLGADILKFTKKLVANQC